MIRSVHIELLQVISSSCFINTFRRFYALRVDVRIAISDCRTNCVGSTTDSDGSMIIVEDQPVKKYLFGSGINWIFNLPHSTHMGGVWERMICVARKMLDVMLEDVKQLTY